MPGTLERILEEALALPDESKLTLAERLVEHVSTRVPPEIEARQLAVVRRRIAEVEAGRVEVVPGEVVLREVREAIERAK